MADMIFIQAGRNKKMLERTIAKHWVALTVGFVLLGVLIRVRYNTQGHFAIGSEWLMPGIVLFVEWLIRKMQKSKGTA